LASCKGRGARIEERRESCLVAVNQFVFRHLIRTGNHPLTNNQQRECSACSQDSLTVTDLLNTHAEGYHGSQNKTSVSTNNQAERLRRSFTPVFNDDQDMALRLDVRADCD
jgi:hypothetical protein